MTSDYIYKDENLEFLKKKIREMRVAMFKAEASSPLCPPNNIVRVIKNDDDGNIYFFTSCNKTYARNIDECFFASLDFYQKGTDCRLRVSGSASIVKDDMEHGNGYVEHDLGEQGLFLIKLKILNAAYGETRPAAASSIKEQVKHFFHKLFYDLECRRFDFSKS